MPSGKKYQIHENAVKKLSKNLDFDFIGPYKKYKMLFGADANMKNSDIISVKNQNIESYELKCHKDGSDWGEVSWDQALRLIEKEKFIIYEYESDNIIQMEGKDFIKKYAYFTKNGRIHYNYKKINKRVESHPVYKEKIINAQEFFK